MINFDPFSLPLLASFDTYSITADNEAIKRLYDYYSLVLEWNTRMNLVSSKDIDRFVEYHLIDSLKPSLIHSFDPDQRILDFGSGAGLPGIPLASIFPSCSFTLLDSRLKRTDFLRQAISTIPIDNCTVIRERAEQLDDSFNGAFDAVVTRATVKLPDFFSLCSRFIKPGGSLISIKGETISSELTSLNAVLDDRLFHITSTTPPSIEGVRNGCIVCIHKR